MVTSTYRSVSGKYTPQYLWLQAELPKVNRSETPWLIVLMHAPWYNSNSYHYMEGETMRVQFESWFVQYKVDVVFAGHVHSYERSVSPLLPQDSEIFVCGGKFYSRSKKRIMSNHEILVN